MTKIAIVGAGGRMGRCLIEAAYASETIELRAVIGRPGSTVIGCDAGELSGIGNLGLPVTDDLEKALDDFDVLVDFTLPEGTLAHAETCAKHGRAMVVGTTGFSRQQEQQLDRLSQHLPLLVAPNMSVGVNLCLSLLKRAASAIGEDMDIEIIEAHHRHKVDAPSGTALQMGRVIAETLGRDLATCAIYGREGRMGPREPGTIGFETIRAGDIVGEHTVMFAGLGERIEISHKASSRMTFAVGAMRAAAWVAGRAPGRYNMNDVLGLA